MADQYMSPEKESGTKRKRPKQEEAATLPPEERLKLHNAAWIYPAEADKLLFRAGIISKDQVDKSTKVPVFKFNAKKPAPKAQPKKKAQPSKPKAKAKAQPSKPKAKMAVTKKGGYRNRPNWKNVKNRLMATGPWDPAGRQTFGYNVRQSDDTTMGLYGPTYYSASEAQRANRQRDNFYGRGSYFKKALKWGGKILNRELSSAANTLIPGAGKFVGRGLRHFGVGMYTGGGMYNGPVMNEVIQGGHASEGVMRFDNQTDEESIVISHSEFVMDVYSPPVAGGVQDTKLELNAGLGRSFPMLAQIAANFEEYEVIQCAFTYKPTLSDWQTTNGQVGSVMFATNHNPNAQLWQTKEQILAATGSTSSKVTQMVYHGIECDPSKHHNDQEFLTRVGPAPLGANLTDYDLGWTQMRVRDVPEPNLSLGELHVSYTVKLRRPRIYSGIGSAIQVFDCRGWKQDPSAAVGLASAQTCAVCDEWDTGNSRWVSPSSGQNSAYVLPDNTWTVTALARQSAFRCLLTNDLTKYVSYTPYFGTPTFGNLIGSIGDATDTARATADAAIGPIFKGCNMLTFPASLQGTFEVEVMLHGKNFHLGSDPALGGSFVIGLGGNVEAVFDMKRIVPSQTANNNHAMTNGWCELHDIEDSGTQYSTLSLKAHVRLKTASSGVDNQMAFTFKHGLLDTSAVAQAKWVSVHIREYNNTLAYKQDGTDDRIIYVNPQSGALIEYDPYTA